MVSMCFYKHSFLLLIFPKEILNAVTNISYFYRDICYNKLHIQHMEKLEININDIIYKLEIIFSLILRHNRTSTRHLA